MPARLRNLMELEPHPNYPILVVGLLIGWLGYCVSAAWLIIMRDLMNEPLKNMRLHSVPSITTLTLIFLTISIAVFASSVVEIGYIIADRKSPPCPVTTQ